MRYTRSALKNISPCTSGLLLTCLAAICLLACSTPKDTAMSRGIQNLTARYNYIYNANQLLDQYDEDLYNNYRDNYNEILPVFTSPEKFSADAPVHTPANERALDAIIKKAQSIIADKAFSNYIDDAYLLLGRAYYYKTNYFIAEEYFDYTAGTYGGNAAVRTAALNWKARSLMQRDNLGAAALVLDTVYYNLPVIRKNKAELLATIAQMYIYQEKYDEAIPMLENAISAGALKRNRIRWTYILAQLYEHQHNAQQALACFLKVQQSNAEFELYFNANLNRIRISGLLNGEKLSRKKQLLALLKDDKNLAYQDQVYYQVAESYAGDGDFETAEKYYRLSAQHSQDNPYQKGLSYLRIADLNFSHFRNFLKAKSYYDSTVTTLPPDYPGYAQLRIKNENLGYLSTRYETIAFEDTVQLLAALPEEARTARIKVLTKPAPVPPPPVVRQNNARNTGSFGSPVTLARGTFYFNNTNAVSTGYTDFQNKWGKRKREDNWRQSVRSSFQTTAENIIRAEDGSKPGTPASSALPRTAENEEKRYLDAVPLSQVQLQASNQRILTSYLEIAAFYQQELGDPAEAAKVYELVLKRFPDNNQLALIYYSLYRSYQSAAPDRAETFKALVLSKFPGSVYAKNLLDPAYNLKQSALEALTLANYNSIFDQYEHRDFHGVISAVSTSLRDRPASFINPQLAYLQAIAIGRTAPSDSLVKALQSILRTYTADKLIVPLVRSHLDYIEAHHSEFARRKIALPDNDPNEPRFFSTPDPLPAAPAVIAAVPAASRPAPAASPAAVPAVPVVTDKVFSTAESAVYYFVIDVADATLTLSSSRFGIGQFNRGNYPDSKLRHQLTEFDNDQLIYVGNFSSFAAANEYAEGITPQLKQIMKVPAGIYTSFIISRENFEKLSRKELVSQYLEFYHHNYQK